MANPIQKIGRYEVREILGEGAAGTVYRGWDTRLKTDVAIKILRTDREASPDSEEAKRLAREVTISRSLQHRHIVSIYDVGDDPATGRTYIVMEFIKGVSLQALPMHKQMSFRESVTLIGQVAQALDYAAQLGIVHRDVKPANILVDLHSLTPKLVDFGTARMQGATITQGQVFVGTPHYMSPEQWRSEKTDGRSDLFSLGVVLYELLTGQKPFSGESLPEIMKGVLDPDRPAPPDQIRPGIIPPALSQAVMKALAKHPQDRYQRGTEMQKALLKALDQPVETATPAASKPKPAARQPVPSRSLDKTLKLKAEDLVPVAPEEEHEPTAPLKPGRAKGLLKITLGLILLPAALLATIWFGWPLVQAYTLPPVTAEAAIFKQTDEGRLVLLNDGDTLLATMPVAINVKPSQEAFVYVLRVSAKGQVIKLFPGAGADEQNPVHAGRLLWLPTTNGQHVWLPPGQPRSREELVIVMTAQPLRQLDDRFGLLEKLQLVNAQSEERLLNNVPKLQTKLMTARAPSAPPPASGALILRRLEGNGLGFFYRIRLEYL